MKSIRINSGVIRINVNDNGDTIALRKDLNFINNIVAFGDGLSVLQEDFNKKAALIADDDGEAKLNLMYETHKELHDGLDGLFGVGTCKKVFGDGEVDVIPTMDAVTEFMEAISPYILEIARSLGGTKVNTPKASTKPLHSFSYGDSQTNNSGAFNAITQKLSNGDEDNEV